MELFKPPDPMIFEGNVSKHWKTFSQEMKFFLTATEKSKKSPEIKCSILLNCIGKKGRELYNTFKYNEGESDLNYDLIVKKFDEICNPKKNETFMRYKFLTTRQTEGQNVDNFVTILKTAAGDCNFDALEDSLVRDMIVIGTSDSKLQERLLRTTDLSLENAIKSAKSAEITQEHAEVMKSAKSPSTSIDYMKKQPYTRKPTPHDGHSSQSTSKEVINSCKFCSYTHIRGNCPAYNRTCNRCNSKGHFAKCCPKLKINNIDERFSANEVSSDDDDCDQSLDNPFFVGVVNSKSTNPSPNEWSIQLQVNNSPINFKIDTGAQVNVLSSQTIESLQKPVQMSPTNIKLTAYNGSPIDVIGKCVTNVTKQGKSYPVQFIVTSNDTIPILGLKTCTDMNLIKRIMNVTNHNDYVVQYKHCFGPIGKLPGIHHITLEENAKPVVQPPRRIPVALQTKLKEELNNMVKLGIIEKANEPTDWVSSLVVVQKPNGKLRVCLDPRDLNKAIKREHYQLPTTEDILAQMANAKYFTKLDASNAYWQIEVDYESSKLLTFNSPHGRYSFKRLPYGIHSASEVCQSKIASIIEGIDGALNVQDDIIIWAETPEILHERTIEVLSAIEKSGMKLNESKCQFHKEQITFLGHLVTSEGIRPDPTKIEAINKMPMPTNVKELQRFLGMVNYLGKFIPKLSEMTSSVRKLLEHDVDWAFEKQHEAAIHQLKKCITTAPVLKYFDPARPTKVSSDFSGEGLGALLEQQHEDEWHPIAYASRTLTPAEHNYSPLEGETLSIVFACERFHEYLYGRKFNACNDHEPLRSVFRKPLHKTPPRLQRFMMRLMKYDFQLEYVKGRYMKVCDAFSRAAVGPAQSEIDNTEMEGYVLSVLESLPISDEKMKKITDETLKDVTLQQVKHQIQHGWSSDNKLTAAYQPHKEELSIVHKMIMRGTQIVIPKSMRSEIKSILHEQGGHQGVVKTKLRARDSVFWPGIGKEIELMIGSCSTCLEFQNKQRPEPLIPHNIPSSPWEKIGTDLFHLYGKHYVIIVDYTSKYFDISQMSDCQSSTVIAHTKKIFSKYGIPKEVFSDNGPEFSSAEYKSFSKQWDFHHETSSPEYPQSNGCVERMIQTVKKCLKKHLKDGDDPYLALLSLRTTPISEIIPAPSTVMFGRKIRTPLPSLYPSTKPLSNDDHNNVLPQLNIGDAVRLHDGNTWSRKGVVSSKCTQPRSFNVETDEGRILRRNRRAILKSPSPQHEHKLPIPELENYTPEEEAETNTDPEITMPTVVRRSGRHTRPPAYLDEYTE